MASFFRMKNSRVTITDLARSLGLSLCTVSKILNRSFDGFTYAPKTIARVEAEAKRLGYRPNPQARSLRTRQSRLIGLVLPSAQIALFGTLTDRLEVELRNRGYHVLIAHTRNDPRVETEVIPEMLERGVDGLIWIPAASRVNLAKAGLRADFPAVILDRSGCTKALPFVATDNRQATRELARRSYELGHRRIGVINAPANDRSMTERLNGLRDVFGDGICLADTDNHPAAGRSATIDLCQRFGGDFTLLIALSESLAIGALAGLREANVRITEDMSFAAFDDFPLASHWSPALTVIRQDVMGLARATVDLLFRRIQAPHDSFASIRIGASLEWRGSVAGVTATVSRVA